MNRILIWRKITPTGNELDIFTTTDYGKVFNQSAQIFGRGNCPNWGNKLWFQGLYSEIDTPENDIVFRSNETIDEINASFDLIIYPMANFFSEEYAPGMADLAECFSKVKIPVYIIACGAQANRYDELDYLIQKIGEPSKRFIDSIYQTGGEFALRGDFTKQFFDKLGYSSAVVTGCPSLYQMGPDFQICQSDLSDDLHPVFNGRIQHIKKIMQAFPDSPYIDQDQFFAMLYDPHYESNILGLRKQAYFYHNHGLYPAQLIAENRIKHIIDMNDWYWYIKKHEINYSLGSRIHGNIMSILCGVRSTVLAIDTRTQEMAEFFDIPYRVIKKGEVLSTHELYDLYQKADYTNFNTNFKTRYEKYERFLRDHGIVSNINIKNSFWNQSSACEDFEHATLNQELFKHVYKQM